MRRVAGLVVACALVVAVAAACSPTGALDRSVSGMSPNERAISADLLARLNQQRAARGLAPVSPDTSLQARSYDWSRTMPGLATPTARLHHSDLHPLLVRYIAAAENIAWTDGGGAGLVHVSWM